MVLHSPQSLPGDPLINMQSSPNKHTNTQGSRLPFGTQLVLTGRATVTSSCWRGNKSRASRRGRPPVPEDALALNSCPCPSGGTDHLFVPGDARLRGTNLLSQGTRDCRSPDLLSLETRDWRDPDAPLARTQASFGRKSEGGGRHLLVCEAGEAGTIFREFYCESAPLLQIS